MEGWNHTIFNVFLRLDTLDYLTFDAWRRRGSIDSIANKKENRYTVDIFLHLDALDSYALDTHTFDAITEELEGNGQTDWKVTDGLEGNGRIGR